MRSYGQAGEDSRGGAARVRACKRLTLRDERPAPGRRPFADRAVIQVRECLLAHAPLQTATLTLRKTTPDTEALIVAECVFKAFGADGAGRADPLCLPSRPALLRKEGLRVGLRAQRALLPAQFFLDVDREAGLSNICVRSVGVKWVDLAVDLNHRVPPRPLSSSKRGSATPAAPPTKNIGGITCASLPTSQAKR